MLSSFVNITQSNSSYDVITKHISSFTIIQRTIFILLIIIIFWIVFIIIYLLSRLIIRILSNLKRSQYHSNTKICQAFVISSNQYGSFRPIETLYRSDSLFSNSNFALSNEKLQTFTNYDTVNLTINLIDNSQYQQTKTSLLEHYLKTYNPLDIDLINTNNEIIPIEDVNITSYKEIPSEIDTQSLDNCYPLHCTNKQKLYTQLKEQENCSATISMIDDRSSECSTKLTSMTLPIVMVTDCSNSQRLHTDIIEMNEEE